MKNNWYCTAVLSIYSLLVFQLNAQDKKVTYVNENQTSGLEKLVEAEDGLHFFVIGDWGKNGYFHQKEVAEMMHQTGFILEPEFIISTGDNFYPDGVASVQDPFFKSSFEDIYEGFNLFCPWYITLGNHEYRGNSQAIIDYAEISQRWKMPDRYYFKDMQLEDSEATARFIFLDTSPFEDEYYEREKYKNVTKQDSLKQKNWLEKTLNESTAEWNIIIGHHPFYTSGKRKDDIPYIRNHLEPLIEKYKVDAYFAGHEHDLQHQKPENVVTHHFVSGAGAETRPTGSLPYTKFSNAESGFMAVSLLKNKMHIQVINWKGEVIYQTKINR
jgi:hypothetical protein